MALAALVRWPGGTGRSRAATLAHVPLFARRALDKG